MEISWARRAASIAEWETGGKTVEDVCACRIVFGSRAAFQILSRLGEPLNWKWQQRDSNQPSVPVAYPVVRAFTLRRNPERRALRLETRLSSRGVTTLQRPNDGTTRANAQLEFGPQVTLHLYQADPNQRPTPDQCCCASLAVNPGLPGQISIQRITEIVYLSSSSSCASSTVTARGPLSLVLPFPSASSVCWLPRPSAATPLTSAAAAVAVAPLLLLLSPVSVWYPKGPTVRSPPKNCARPPQFGASGMGAVTTGGCLRAAVSGRVAPCEPGRRDGSGMLLVGGLPNCPVR